MARRVTASKAAAAASASSSPTIRVRFFDADRTDDDLTLDQALKRKPNDRQLLWIDTEGALDDETAARLQRRFQLNARTTRVLADPGKGPHLALHGTYFHVRVATEAPDDPGERARWLDAIAGDNVVITAHADPIDFLAKMDERIETDASIGRIDAASFVRSLLDAAITSYYRAVDTIEADVDDLDARSLRGRDDERLLDELVAVRRRIARLRRVLSDHREVYASLAGADFATIAEGEDVAAGFATVAGRFEDAIHAVEDSRDLLLGSFDVYMTRTAQRTNDVMKVLALATVLLLPGSLLAGLLGMNVVVPLPKDDPVSFWIVIGAIAVLAIIVVVVAWRRDWIRLGGG